MRDITREALARLKAEATANRRHAFKYARGEPSPTDVAIHPESERFHDPAHVNGEDVGYVTEQVAEAAGLDECPHCSPNGRRAVIQGPGGGADA